MTGLVLNLKQTTRELTAPLFRVGDTGPTISAGTGSPEGAVTAPVASLWLRTNGGTDTAVYRKETGAGNTGWVAMAAGGGGGGSTNIDGGNAASIATTNIDGGTAAS